MTDHIHDVIDSDTYFVVDAITRKISTESAKKSIVQGDHNSEIFTFEFPRYIDGHDMSSCTVAQVHYINIESKTKNESRDVYETTDIRIEGEKVVFSWIIRSSATMYGGTLNFICTLKCTQQDGTLDYSWSTEIYKKISVLPGIDNGEQVIEEASDILASWKAEVMADIESSMADITAAVESAAASATSASNSVDMAERMAMSAYSDASSAQESASSAETSATTAESMAISASQSATSASESASSAEQSKTAAASSASTAQTAAESADSMAMSAYQSKEAAQESATSASESATSAETSASSALESKESALESAIEAATVAAPAILCEAVGEHIYVTDSAERLIQGLKIKGKTTQNGEPTPTAPVGIVGLLAGTKIHVCKKNLADMSKFTGVNGTVTHTDNGLTYSGTWYVSQPMYLKAGEVFTASFTMTGYNAASSYGNRWRVKYVDDTYSIVIGNGVSFTLEKDIKEFLVYISDTTMATATISNVQLEKGDTATEYEPYEGYELTTPCTLYDGDIWFPLTGKVERASEVLAFTGNENWIKYTASDAASHTYCIEIADTMIGLQLSKCSHFRNKNFSWNTATGNVGDFSDNGSSKYKYFVSDQTTAEAFKTWLAEKNSGGTPVVLVYKLEAPVTENYTAVDLSTIKTFKPITNITNSAGATVDVVYLADTKIYLDHLFPITVTFESLSVSSYDAMFGEVVQARGGRLSPDAVKQADNVRLIINVGNISNVFYLSYTSGNALFFTGVDKDDILRIVTLILDNDDWIIDDTYTM